MNEKTKIKMAIFGSVFLTIFSAGALFAAWQLKGSVLGASKEISSRHMSMSTSETGPWDTALTSLWNGGAVYNASGSGTLFHDSNDIYFKSNKSIASIDLSSLNVVRTTPFAALDPADYGTDADICEYMEVTVGGVPAGTIADLAATPYNFAWVDTNSDGVSDAYTIDVVFNDKAVIVNYDETADASCDFDLDFVGNETP